MEQADWNKQLVTAQKRVGANPKKILLRPTTVNAIPKTK